MADLVRQNWNFIKIYKRFIEVRTIELNKIYNEDNITLIKKIPGDFIDLTVTSPPYDNLRDYKGYTFDFETLAEELYRVTKPGGVVVWVVGDATVNGSETGTSFRQALKFMDVGFNLADTMIWDKDNCSSIGALNKYESVFEYMFLFSKGNMKTTNIIKDKPNKRAGSKRNSSIRQPDGTLRATNIHGNERVQEYGRRSNVWRIYPAKSMRERLHPAPFPIQLAKDHIISWSDKGDLVFDPFMGSGTTAVAALDVGRKYIGAEIAKEYVDIANERIKNHVTQTELFDFI